MAWYTTAIKVASGVISLIKGLSSGSGDIGSIYKKLDEILIAIEDSKFEIIRELHELERRELSGKLGGLIITLRSYDPVKADEPRLLRVIDDAAILIGRLEQILEDANARSPRFISALIMLLNTSYLRAFAMVERERKSNFKNPEIKDIPAMLDIPIMWLSEAIAGVGNINQRVNCNGETRPHIDGLYHGFRFDGKFIGVDWQQLENPRDGVQAEPPTRPSKSAAAACERKKLELQTSIDNFQIEVNFLKDIQDYIEGNF